MLNVVQRFAHYKSELARSKDFGPPKDVEEAAENAQFTYKLIDYMTRIKTDIEKYQLSSMEIGFTKGELKNSIRDAHLTTIEQLKVVDRFGTTNRCLWEGGCFSTKQDIKNTSQTIKIWAQNLDNN